MSHIEVSGLFSPEKQKKSCGKYFKIDPEQIFFGVYPHFLGCQLSKHLELEKHSEKRFRFSMSIYS
jgi:hypothetical protein